MVKLTWENKSNISKNIEDLKIRYLNYFKTVDLGIGDFQGNNWRNMLFWGGKPRCALLFNESFLWKDRFNLY
ncbi:hypothetical protein ES708_20373 [subsurface metagenome]